MKSLKYLLVIFALLCCVSFASEQFVSSTYTVYITNSGTKYHKSSCSYLSKSKISKTIKEAIEQGYTPCKKCSPPKS
jgi:hypothetical protein